MRYIPLLFLLAGCMMGPKYVPPEIQMNEDWISEETGNPCEPFVSKWWELFEDELLNKYIASAEKNNFDVLTAEANILRARALKMVNASTLFPQISANFIPLRVDFSKNGPFFGGIEKKASSASPFLRVFNLFNAFFDASWELDLFGKTRYAVRQAEALIDSAIEQKKDTLISTYAEVARNYIELRSVQEKKELMEEIISLFEEHVFILQKNFEAGYSNRLDVTKLEAELETAKGDLPEMIAEIYRSIYSLSILTGQLPESLVEELIEPKPIPKAPRMVSLGFRSDLLRRRPDIRRAERDLAAATANVGVSVASFFPTITLFGLGGFQSLKIPELFDWNSKIWTYGLNANMPIFQGGKIVGNLHLTQAEQSAAAFTYQNTVLLALQEAESFLMAYKQQVQAAIDFSDAVFSNELAKNISEDRFKKGLVNKIEFLNSERQFAQAKITALASDTATLLSLISLYKALGGGWEDDEFYSNILSE